MAEVTRVPLKPVKKGSLTKLWVGIIAVLLIAGGLAWSTVPAGIKLVELKPGIGANPTDGDVVIIDYKGQLTDGTVFDENKQTPMLIGGTVPGFDEGLRRMQAGGKYRIEIPAEKAYGAAPPPGSVIPPDADLVFEVELTEFMSREDYESRMEAMQQLMQQMQQQEQKPGEAGQ